MTSVNKNRYIRVTLGKEKRERKEKTYNALCNRGSGEYCNVYICNHDQCKDYVYHTRLICGLCNRQANIHYCTE